jgi:tetratricopeptide (TPR) repeat protein
MTKDPFHQPTDDLGESHDDEVLVTTSVTADSPADQPIEGEPKAQAERAEAEPEPTGESLSDEALAEGPPAEDIPAEVPMIEAIPPLAEAAVEPAKRPWWERLFGSLFGREAEAMVEVEPPPVVEAVPPPKVAPEAVAPEEVREEVPKAPEEGPPTEEIPPEVPVVEVVPAPAEVAREPSKRPWWGRLFGSLFRREAEAPPVVEAVPPPEVAPEVITPEMVPKDAARYDQLLATMIEREVAPPSEVLPEAVAPAAPPFTLDDVRELVREEMACMQEDTARMVQAALAREQEEWQRASLTAVRAVADGIHSVKAESIRVELEALREQEGRTLRDYDRPLRDRMEEVDYIRERVAKAKQDIAELEAAAARRVVRTADRRAELEGRGGVADLREEVVRQKEAIVAVEARLASLPRAGGGPGLWPTLLALLLVAVVGLAGILLPRQAGPAPTFLVEMATMYRAAGETEEAIRVLDEAVQAGIGDVETLGRVGEMYRVLKEYEKAIALLKPVVGQDQRNVHYRLSLARSYGGAGQHWEAVTQYQMLLVINPANIWYHAELGHRYKSLKLYDQAIAQYQEMLEVDPNSWQAYYHQGEVYRALERYDEAIDHYQQALEINPNDYWTRVWCGMSYAARNDLAHAIEHYQAAIEIGPDQPRAYYYLGEAYLAQGHFDQAVASYQRAIEIYDRFTAAYVGLGKAYVALDDCPNAIVQFTKALTLSPNNADAQEALEACVEK